MKDRATIVCLQRGRVLLVSRDRSRWALPGGSIKRGETPLDGALRELAEETNLSLERVEYQFLFGGLTKRHHVFVVDVPEDAIATARNEIARCHWFDCKQVSTITASIPTRKIVELVFHNAAIVHPPE
jgi:8-oxo-dGTP pyrophosphatase MutT (NUDIX family)